MKSDTILDKFNLRSKLKFDPDAGLIWLNENRMLLMHAQAMSQLRTELFNAFEPEVAQGLLFRMGFHAGAYDADMACELFGEGDNFDVFQIGPEMHAFEGIVKSKIIESEINWEEGSFYGEIECKVSWEAESHLQHFGVGDEVGCWNLTGFASGYATRFFKRFIVFKETKCVCKGDETCVIVGKPAEAWGEDLYADYFKLPDGKELLTQVRSELNDLRGGKEPAPALDGLIGASCAFKNAFELLSKAANSPISVLLLGETGVGKEMFARWLHEHSCRADKPFVTINCAAIPNDLIEAELFGVKRGAYTGAQDSRPGRFERADGGTLFLDELGELSLAAQAKLLRVLQTGEVERLGDHQVRKVNVRLVAATNVDLEAAMQEGRFRSDLFYRVATYPVQIPPLRERRSDISLLASAMIEKYAEAYSKKIQGFTDKAMDALLSYNWPGNVRELENLVERGVLLAEDNGLIQQDHLFPKALKENEAFTKVSSTGFVENVNPHLESFYDDLLDQENFDFELHKKNIYEAALRRADGNYTKASKMLGITRRQLAYNMNKE